MSEDLKETHLKENPNIQILMHETLQYKSADLDKTLYLKLFIQVLQSNL